jgi:hypothetical protein
MTIFFNIDTMPDWINLGYSLTWVMDFNEFNNFFIYILFLFNFIIKLNACKIEYQP